MSCLNGVRSFFTSIPGVNIFFSSSSSSSGAQGSPQPSSSASVGNKRKRESSISEGSHGSTVPTTSFSSLSSSSAPTLKQDEVLAGRQLLINFLGVYFELDSMGYINKSRGQHQELNNPENIKQLVNCFYDVAFKGDPGYAHEIKTQLSGVYGIISDQVHKTYDLSEPNKIDPMTHIPANFAKADHDKNDEYSMGQTTPMHTNHHRRSYSAYLDEFDRSIWLGFHNHRKANPCKVVTEAQHLDYNRRMARVKELHQEGWLLKRYIKIQEAKNLMAHRYFRISKYSEIDLMDHNNILATTLLPKTNSPIQLGFIKDEYNLLLDPFRVDKSNLAYTFIDDATSHQDHPFSRHINEKKKIGVTELAGLRELLSNLEGYHSKNEQVTISPNKDRNGYDISELKSYTGKLYEIGDKVYYPNRPMYPNEVTFYRGIARDLTLAFCTSTPCEPKKISNIYKLQSDILRTKGLFIPVFGFDYKTNTLTELSPTKESLFVE